MSDMPCSDTNIEKSAADRASVSKIFSRISPSALTHIDQEGLALLARLKAGSPRTRAPRQQHWEPETVVAGTITASDMVGGVTVESVDALTMCSDSIRWDTTGLELRLEGADYQQLERLANMVASIKQLSRHVVAPSVKSMIVRWISSIRMGTTTLTLSARLREEFQESVRTRTYCIPIAWLHIQSEIRFGGCRLVVLNMAAQDRWREAISSKGPPSQIPWQPRGQLRDVFERAWTGMECTLFGEALACQQQAQQKAHDICSLLRFLWPGNFKLGSRCFVAPVGTEAPPQRIIVELEQGVPSLIAEGLTGPPPEPLVLSDEYTSTVADFIEGMSSLASLQHPTDFQSQLLAALLLHARNSVHVDIVDRVIAVLVSLEAMLLRGTSEPIQSSLSQRLAVLTMDSVEERKALMIAVKRCYGIRSSFLHHGERLTEERAAVELVLTATWQFLGECVLNHHRVKSMSDFNARIDASLLGGQRVSMAR